MASPRLFTKILVDFLFDLYLLNLLLKHAPNHTQPGVEVFRIASSEVKYPQLQKELSYCFLVPIIVLLIPF